MPGTESSVTPSVDVVVLVITLPFPERDNKAPLPFSWDDACVPGRAQNCTQRHEYSISTSLEKISMDATDPWSFTPFQQVNRSLCFHKRRWITVDWRVSNRDSNTPDILLNSWWVILVQPLKVTSTAGLHFRLFCQEHTTLLSYCSTLRQWFSTFWSRDPPKNLSWGSRPPSRLTLETHCSDVTERIKKSTVPGAHWSTPRYCQLLKLTRTKLN